MHMERPTIRSGLQFLERVKARTVRPAAFGTHKYAGFRILEIMERRILQSFYFALHCDTDKAMPNTLRPQSSLEAERDADLRKDRMTNT